MLWNPCPIFVCHSLAQLCIKWSSNSEQNQVHIEKFSEICRMKHKHSNLIQLILRVKQFHNIWWGEGGAAHQVSPLQTRWCCHYRYQASGDPMRKFTKMTCWTQISVRQFAYLHEFIHGAFCRRSLSCHQITHITAATAHLAHTFSPRYSQAQHSPEYRHLYTHGRTKRVKAQNLSREIVTDQRFDLVIIYCHNCSFSSWFENVR